MAKADNKIDIFLNEMLSGKSQRQSYYVAYPNSKKWKEATVDVKASLLMSDNKVRIRYNELLEANRNKSIITREELLKGLARGFKMALGEEGMNVTLTDKGFVTEETEIKSVDLKALASIAEKIAKMEGWVIDKMEHSGGIDIKIVKVKK